MIIFKIKNFLKNPNKGGIPPKDINNNTIEIFSKKFILFTCINVL